MSREKLRILEVCTVPTERSGIPNVIFNLMRNMDNTAFKIGYVAINEPAAYFMDQLGSLGVTLHVIPRKLSSPWSYVRNLIEVAKGYDVIHVHGNSATMLLEMIAAGCAGINVRATHSHSTSCRMKLIDTLARPLFHSLNNLRLACGRGAGKWLYGRRTFDIINNGIDTSKFAFNESDRQEIRLSYGITGKFVLGNVANFDKVKNHDFLIDVFADILKKRADVVLMLIGSGSLIDYCKSKVESLGIGESVIFAGNVDAPWRFMSAMDLVVMPSLYEGMPLTLVEEQANGLTCLVSTGVSQDIDLTGNVLFLPLDRGVEGWSAEISALMESDRLRHGSESSKRAIKLIREKGFDIRDSAATLKEIFLKKASK